MKNHPTRFALSAFLIIFVLSLIVGLVIAQVMPRLIVNNDDSFVVDSNGNGLADEGDVIRYTVVIANCEGDAAQNVRYNSQLDPNTELVPNSITQSGLEAAQNCPPASNPVANPSNPTAVPANPAPFVQNSNPANGGTEVALAANTTVQFNKAVNVSGDWFEIVCTLSGTFNISSGNVAVTGGPINWTFDPNVDLQVGDVCTVTVFAANVTDVDNNDPPDNMAADYVFTFTAETPPTVLSTTPTNGASAVINSDDIVIVFDEPVNFSAASFTLECPAGTPFAGGFAVSGTGTDTATINPTGNLPSGTTCQVLVLASSPNGVSDVDANDPPDFLDGNGDNIEGDDYIFSFTTDVDAAPTVITISPANGAVSIPTNTTIEIEFSELVDIASAANFNLECGGAPQGYTVTTPATLPASTSTVIITPAGNLPDATTCTVTVFNSVTDSDSDDPPDNMAADFVSSFTTEAPPNVTSTNPANGATGIGTGSNIVIDFDEPVDVLSNNAFAIECPTGGTSYTFTVTGSGTNSITLDPDTNLIANETCTVTVFASPDLVDSDVIDPPDTMVADYVFSFDTIADTAPVASSPLDGATGVATSSNIVINFDEPVDVVDTPSPTFTLICAGSPVGFTTIPGLPTTNQSSITLDPIAVLPATSTCTVTVEADNVTDTDLDEPPDNMAADYSFSFDTIVDLAPTVDQANIAPASTSTGANSASLDAPVSTTPTITIPFSEAVDVATGAFTLICNATPVSFSTSPALPTSVGQTSIDVSATTAIAEGANCVLTVVALNVADSDFDDPPNLMVTDFSLSFSIDTAPVESLTETEVGGVFQDVTGAGATNVDLDSDIQITFNEAVNITFPANGLQCPAGNNIPVTVTTNGVATIVLNPDNNLPLNTVCILNIPAANISDVDTADAPDNSVAAVSHSFTTVDDDAPTVSTNPAAGGSNIAVNSNITVTFNEPVTLTGAWFDLTCSVSGNRVSTGELTGTGITIIENTPDLVYTIDPTSDLASGDICTITIDSANVVDNDLIDPPNELDGNADADIVDGDADDYVATFSTMDMAPQVLNTSPASTGTVAADEVVTINFTETVDVAAGAFTFECPAGTPLTNGFNTSVALPATAISTIDLSPVDPLPFGATCTVTIISSLVVDSDPVDPPNELDGDNSGDLIDGDADNFSLNFQVDAEPTLLSSEVEISGVLSPAAGAVNVDLDTNIVLTFSEAVNADTSSFSLECPAGTAIAFTVLGTGTNVITVDPTPAFLAINTLCDFDIIAANISDVDTFDAPDILAADINLTFTTVNDDFPEVTSAEIEVGGVFTALPLVAQYADADTDLRLTFSEAVTVTGNWAELNCTVSGIQDVSGALGVTDADPVFTLNPATDLSPGEDCTLTVFAPQIADDDAIDPPDNMLVDAVFSFTVLDTAPQVDLASSSPADGDTVANTVLVTIGFTEMVDIAAGAISFECDASPVAFTPALPQDNVMSITLTPSTPLDNGASCTVTLASTLITDDDLADAPNELDGDFSNDIIDGDADDLVLAFTVDLPPTVLIATVEVAGVPSFLPLGLGTVVDLDSNIVISFSEAIDSTASGVSLECPAGNPIAFAGLPVVNGTSITLNPSADLPGDTLCVVTVIAAQTTDTDLIDPPNQLDGNGDTVEGDVISFSFTTQAAAIDDAYTITPHLTYNSALAGLSVRDNDQPTTVSITGFGATLGTAGDIVPNGTNSVTANGAGGRVVMNADGTFTFYPDAGDNAATGTATFFYTVTGGDTAQVTLTFEAEEFVWFVDNTPPGTSVCTGTNVGTQACPSADLATVSAVDTATDTIFVASGSYTCGIVLEVNERLIGDGASGNLQSLSGVSPVAGSNFDPYATFSGTDPVLTSSAADCITLATGNLIQGVTIGNTGNFAGIVGNGFGTLTLSESTINGTGQTVDLNNGVLAVSFDALSSSSSDASSAAIEVTSSSGNFTVLGNTSISASSTTGVSLGTNTATFTFADLDITPNAAQRAFHATSNTGTITSTSGTMISTNVATVEITGASSASLTPLNMTLSSVSANGGANGITISNTSGSFTITGDSGVAANGSGGTIQNTTNDAVQLNNTNGLISLNYMIIQDVGDMTGPLNTRSGHDAIQGLNVNSGLSLNRTIIRRISDQAIHGGIYGSPDTPTVWNGLTITNSLIENTNRYHVAGIGDANNEGMIRILGIRGTVTITNSTLQDGAEMLDLFVNAGTLNLTVTASTFNRSYKEFTSGTLASVGNHCIDVIVQGTGSANVVVGSQTVLASGNDFLNCRIGSIRVVNDTGSTGNSTFIAGNNSLVVDDHSSGIGGDFDFPQGGILAMTLGTGAMDVIIENNYFDEITNASGGVGQLSLSIDNGTMQALVRGNTFDTPGNAPWWVIARGGNGRVQFVNNTVIRAAFPCTTDPSCGGGYFGPGLRTLFDAQNGSTLNVTMTNNTLAQHDTGFDPGQTVEFRNINVGSAPTMCVALTNNQSPDGYSLEQFAGTFNLDNGVDPFTGVCSVAQCQTVLQSNGNTGSAGNPFISPPFVNLIGNVNVVNATCPVPTGSIFP